MATSIKLTPREIALASGEKVPTEPPELIDQDDEQPIEETPGSAEAADDVEEAQAGAEAPPTDEELSSDDDFADDADSGDDLADDDDWTSDPAVKAFAASYGMTDDEIDQFESLEQLERFGALFDRQMTKAPAGEHQQYQQAPPREQPAPATKTPPPHESTEQGSVNEGPELIDIEAMREANYDEISIQLAERENRRSKAEWEQQQTQAVQQERALQEHFNAELDKLDPQRYGVREKGLTKMQELGRQATFETMLQLHQTLQQRGQADIPLDVLIRRSAVATFGEPAKPKMDPARAKQVEQRSRRRRPTSTGKRTGGSAAPVSTTSDNDVETIANSPEMKKFWERTQRQNGVV